jgi:hypothetical protein
MRSNTLSAYLITIFTLFFDALELLIEAVGTNELILLNFVSMLLAVYTLPRELIDKTPFI